MVIKKLIGVIFVLVFGVLAACTPQQVKEIGAYSTEPKSGLSSLSKWSFEGRLALKGVKEAWQANIAWHHVINEESVKLSGPLGQGATLIHLAGDLVSIDRGDGKTSSSSHSEEFVRQQLGVFVPVRSLRYWVVGLPEPKSSFIKTNNGFKQAEWMIEYDQMQKINDYLLPHKITVTNPKVKLKLIIDQWDLNDAKAE